MATSTLCVPLNTEPERLEDVLPAVDLFVSPSRRAIHAVSRALIFSVC
jgi:hypothetical protein